VRVPPGADGLALGRRDALATFRTDAHTHTHNTAATEQTLEKLPICSPLWHKALLASPQQRQRRHHQRSPKPEMPLPLPWKAA